ncbi:MAG: AAA family ATPase [Candidatus Cryptobacteroides sp.]
MYRRAQLSILETRMAEPRRTIQVIMGPRQIGKSTMISQFVELTSIPYTLFSADGVGKTNTEWISEKWHETRIRMMLNNEPEHILIIDEIQKIAGWSEMVKKEWDLDTREKRNLKVILLGSSRLLIQKGLIVVFSIFFGSELPGGENCYKKDKSEDIVREMKFC